MLTAASGVGAYGAAIRLLFLTAARLNEVCGMRWRDLDLDAGCWTLARTKSGAPHAVPLPRQAVALLRALQPEEASPEALVLATRGGKALNNWDRAAKALHEASDTAGWHRHDIRRTVASLAGDLGVAPHVVEASWAMCWAPAATGRASVARRPSTTAAVTSASMPKRCSSWPTSWS